jgi:hypothetical protein
MVRSPVDICLGTRPSQAEKSRPLANATPLPIAATIALEMIGPIPAQTKHSSQGMLSTFECHCGRTATAFAPLITYYSSMLMRWLTSWYRVTDLGRLGFDVVETIVTHGRGTPLKFAKLAADFEFSKNAPTFQHVAAQEVRVIPRASQCSSSARSDFEPPSRSVK